MTVAFTNCEAMRNLVTVRVVPQSAPQVTAKLSGTGPGNGVGPNGAGPGNGDGPVNAGSGIGPGNGGGQARAGAKQRCVSLATVEAGMLV